MGCGSSKKSLPDRPSEVDCEKIKPSHRSRRNNTKSSGGKRGNNTTKTPKYRTKIDSRVLAKYDIKALIGKGSFSDVLRVDNKVTKQPYAVKILRLKTANTRDLFESELAVLRRVRHQYVIQLIEVFESKDCIYLVMELATGGELYDRIKMKGHLNEKETVRVLRMVLEGVRYLHGIGVTHRDLKPENVLFYHPGHGSKILITDFGFAKSKDIANDDSLFTTWCGTPEYIAPELIWKKPYTNAVDMWAIGVITYVMLSGHLPFAAENTVKLYQQIVRANYSFTKEVWKNTSEGCRNFIDKLLVKDPNNRATAADCLQHPWVTSYQSLFSKNSAYAKYSSQNSGTGKSGKSGKSTKYSRSGRSRQRWHEETSMTASRYSQDEVETSEKKMTVPYLSDTSASAEKSAREVNHRNNLKREKELSSGLMSPGTPNDQSRTPNNRKEKNHTKIEKMSSVKFAKSVGLVQEEFPSAAATEGSDSVLINSGVNHVDSNPFVGSRDITNLNAKKYEQMELENVRSEVSNKVRDGDHALEQDGSNVLLHNLSANGIGSNDNMVHLNHASSAIMNPTNRTAPPNFSLYNNFSQSLTASRLHAKSFASLTSALKSPRLLSGGGETSFMERVGQWLEEQRYLDSAPRAADNKSSAEDNFVMDPAAAISSDSKQYFGLPREARRNGDVAVINDSKRSKRTHHSEEGLTSKIVNHFHVGSTISEHGNGVTVQGNRYPLNLSMDGMLEKANNSLEDENAQLRENVFKHPSNGQQMGLPSLLNFVSPSFKVENGLSESQRAAASPDISYVESHLEHSERVSPRRERNHADEKARAPPNDTLQKREWNGKHLHISKNGRYLPEGS